MYASRKFRHWTFSAISLSLLELYWNLRILPRPWLESRLSSLYQHRYFSAKVQGIAYDIAQWNLLGLEPDFVRGWLVFIGNCFVKARSFLFSCIRHECYFLFFYFQVFAMNFIFLFFYFHVFAMNVIFRGTSLNERKEGLHIIIIIIIIIL
jgi:hypothetical protein